MVFDIRTLIILNFIITVINLGSLAVIWAQYRNRFAGISSWLVSTFLHAVGLFLIVMRLEIPPFIAIVVANAILLIGAVVLLSGLENFVGVKGKHVHNYLLIAVFVVATSYYTVVEPSMTMREIVMSMMIVLIQSQGCWLLLRRVAPGLRAITRITGIVLGSYVVVSLIRMVLLILYPMQTNDFFKSGFADSMAITMYIIISICLTISIILMVTRRLLAEVQMQEEKFTTAFHSSTYAILLTRLSDGIIMEVNDGFVALFGHEYDAVIGKSILDLGIWHKENERIVIVKELLRGNEVRGAEIQFKKKNGELMMGLFSANEIIINNEKCILSNISDITELSEMKEKLQVLATHDSLTGLPNRRLFFDRFELALANAKRSGKKMAILSIDLDYFKTINDQMGHDIGDAVLVEAAVRMKALLRKVDIVARFGGDEFVLMLWEINHQADAVTVVQKILNAFRQPFKVGEYRFNLSVSIGGAICPDEGQDIDDLIKKSDEALYFVKSQGRNDYKFFSELKREETRGV